MEFFKELTRYLQILGEQREDSLESLLGLLQEGQNSFFMGDNAFLFRVRFFGLQMANLLVDSKGKIQENRLVSLQKRFAQGVYNLGPTRESDALFLSHLGSCLERLSQDTQLKKAIERFSLPVEGERVIELIKQTLFPEKVDKLTNYHVKKAALAAWFTLLRQAVGSCFATAPAILIQKHNPHRFFQDLYDLLTLGALKRVIHGRQYVAPLTFSSRLGLEKQIGIKEVISFLPALFFAFKEAGFETSQEEILLFIKKREKKLSIEEFISEFLRSLFHLTHEDLQGEALLEKIQIHPKIGGDYFYQKPSLRAEKVEAWKKAVEKVCFAFCSFSDNSLLRAWEYTIASFSDLKTDFHKWNLAIGLGLNPEEEEGVTHFLYNWLNEKLQQIEKKSFEFRDEYQRALYALDNAKKMSALHPEATRRLSAEVSVAAHTAKMAKQMIETLRRQAEEISRFFPDLIAAIQERLQEHFQEVFDPSVFEAGARSHEDAPAGFRLVFKEKVARSSLWSPIFDGEGYLKAIEEIFLSLERELFVPANLGKEFLSEMISALLQHVKKTSFLEEAKVRAQKAGRKSPWDYVSGGTLETLIESYYGFTRPLELVKWHPKSYQELFSQIKKLQYEEEKVLLMHSPTHAFVFDAALLQEENSFSPREIDGIDFEVREFFIEQIGKEIEEKRRFNFFHMAKMHCFQGGALDFQHHLSSVASQFSDHLTLNFVDSCFFENWPLLTQEEMAAVSEDLGIGVLSKGERLGRSRFISEIKQKILEKSSPLSSVDWDLKIEEALRKRGLFYAHSFLFADTNWADWFFAFVLHPLRKEMELWRVNRLSSRGVPMRDWHTWVSLHNEIPWVVLKEDFVGKIL